VSNLIIFDAKSLPQDKSSSDEKPLVMLVVNGAENINLLRKQLDTHFQIITSLNGRKTVELIDNLVVPKKYS